MESSIHNSSKRSLVHEEEEEEEEEEEANISTFRRRNKIIILVLVFLIISLTLTLAALIISLVCLDSSKPQSHKPPLNPVLEAFCYVSDATTCLRTLNPIISNKLISDPNQVFSLSLQAASEDLQRTIASLTTHSDTGNVVFKNCSDSLRDGLDQIRDPLEEMRVDPFVEWKSDEQRREMMNRIMAAEEDVESCLHDLVKKIDGWSSVGCEVTTAELLKVKAYLNVAGDFVMGYVEVLQILEAAEINGSSVIFENAFGICMCGSQLLFVFCLFFSLFRLNSGS